VTSNDRRFPFTVRSCPFRAGREANAQAVLWSGGAPVVGRQHPLLLPEGVAGIHCRPPRSAPRRPGDAV